MDVDGSPLKTISERSTTDDSFTPVKPKRGKRAPLPSANAVDGMENGDVSITTPAQPAKLEAPAPPEPPMEMKKYNQVEVTSIADDDDVPGEEKFPPPRFSQRTNDHESTMVSSYTAGGDNDVIEIHQFSLADVDAYLDIYFETLSNRLRHYIGEGEQLQQFRVAMKTRISSDPNAREFQNVLLGKMNGEVLAALTMSFPGDTPTITPPSATPEQNSCLTSVRRWLVRKANYVPTHMEECYIEMIGVKSSYRNHGIGAAMLECVEQFARQASANRLTIHSSGAQLRHYFERYGFNVDTSDGSALWKWVLERQGVDKLTKILTPDTDNDYTANSYINESMADSLNET